MKVQTIEASKIESQYGDHQLYRFIGMEGTQILDIVEVDQAEWTYEEALEFVLDRWSCETAEVKKMNFEI